MPVFRSHGALRHNDCTVTLRDKPQWWMEVLGEQDWCREMALERALKQTVKGESMSDHEVVKVGREEPGADPRTPSPKK